MAVKVRNHVVTPDTEDRSHGAREISEIASRSKFDGIIVMYWSLGPDMGGGWGGE